MRLRRPTRQEPMNWLAAMPAAHRGLHDPAHPENSLAAFEQACVFGYAIELDVLLTSDGVPVVFHDEDTARMTGVAMDVAASRFADLQSLRIGGTDERIPSLEDVARLVGPRAPLLVEVKTGPSPAAICPQVLDALLANDVRFAILSFDPRVLIWLKRHAPQVIRVQLSGAMRHEQVPAITRVLLRSMLLNAVTRPHAIAYDIACAPSAPLRLWRWLLRCVVLFWTIDSPSALERARQLDGNVIFENVRP